jgi:hypothetical protein
VLGEHRQGVTAALFFVAEHLVAITGSLFAVVLLWQVVLGAPAGERATTDADSGATPEPSMGDEAEVAVRLSAPPAGWSNAVHMISLKSHDLVATDPAATPKQFPDRLHELLVALALETGRRVDGPNRSPPRVAVLGRAKDGVLCIRGQSYCTHMSDSPDATSFGTAKGYAGARSTPRWRGERACATRRADRRPSRSQNRSRSAATSWRPNSARSSRALRFGLLLGRVHATPKRSASRHEGAIV